MGLETNVLILGKTGVGKSSFINYIYGKKMRETGTGKPVTAKGIFKVVFKFEELTVNIYDSWGLEANKADSWETEIGNYLKEHNESMEIKDWFHTIYYCFSTQAARIEDFEINNIIKPLIDKGNKVSIILTHSDVVGADIKSKAMIDILKGKLNIDESSIIKVANESKKLLGGTVRETFGREKVLSKLKYNLWEDIKNKLPLNFEKYIKKELDNWLSDSNRLINNEVKFLNAKSSVERVTDRINSGLKSRFSSIDKRTEKISAKAIEYYIALVNVNNNLFQTTMVLSNIGRKSANFKTEKINFKYDLYLKFGYWAIIAVCTLLPLGSIVAPYTAKHNIKRALRKSLNERHAEVTKEIPKLVQQFRSALEGNLNQVKLMG